MLAVCFSFQCSPQDDWRLLMPLFHPCVFLQSGLSSVSWRLADGVIQCRFRRPVKLTNQDAARYDLDREYFLFLASGHAHNGDKLYIYVFCWSPWPQQSSCDSEANNSFPHSSSWNSWHFYYPTVESVTIILEILAYASDIVALCSSFIKCSTEMVTKKQWQRLY